jgi:protein-L-isoaspartate O-methyltransferase
VNQTDHNQSIVDQFTRQAIPFSQKSQMSSEAAFKLMMDLCQVNDADGVLDVACGPGLTACALARTAAVWEWAFTNAAKQFIFTIRR